MKATKLVTGASLLIAMLAVGFAPTAAADGVTDCTPVNGYGIMGFGGDEEITTCVDEKETACADKPEVEKELCFLLGP